ncbi:MAG: 4'-phosphopantetheinyl transferase superfamily protein [Spirochaetia bacterium]|nr:4'-phosphopantetheinyl transferase superfamily protein [Spirochaetia bacterium]
MDSRLGILSIGSRIYKDQHEKGLELLSLMEEELMRKHPERTKTPAGRPEYTDCPVDFNISHAGNLVICAMADGRTGCDIERADRKVSLSIAEKFFHTEEKVFLESAENPEEKKKRFMMLWVLKEAHIKLLGTSIGAVKETPSFAIRGDKILCQSNLFYSLYEGGGYVMATAFERMADRDNLEIKKYNDIPDFILTAVN